MRTASLDASSLDSELISLLLTPLHAALKFFHVLTLISWITPNSFSLLWSPITNLNLSHYFGFRSGKSAYGTLMPPTDL